MTEMKLYAPNEFWNNPEKNCNGCGSELNHTNRIVPDTMWGLNVRPCCCIHDDMYERGKTLGDKLFADAVFLMNLTIMIIYRSSSFMKIPRLLRAGKYFTGVATAGEDSFFFEKRRNYAMAITYRGSFRAIPIKKEKQ